MSAEINLRTDLFALLECCAALSNLSPSELLNIILKTHAFDLHALLALVKSHPNVCANAAEVLQNFGDQSLISAIIEIAPSDYPTLELLFAHCDAMWDSHSSGQHE